MGRVERVRVQRRKCEMQLFKDRYQDHVMLTMSADD